MTQQSRGVPRDYWELEDPNALANLTLDGLVSREPFKETQDTKGHEVTVGAKVPKWFLRSVDILTQSLKTPYKVRSDTVRDAIYLGMLILNKRYSEDTDWTIEESLARVTSQVKAVADIREKVDAFLKGLEDLWDGKDKEQAAQRLSEFINSIANYSDKFKRKKHFQFLVQHHLVHTVARLCDIEVQQLLEVEEE